eukprot:scaffold5763_cov249-Pinguiococcus_pyrenoidosus.AAC.5
MMLANRQCLRTCSASSSRSSTSSIRNAQSARCLFPLSLSFDGCTKCGDRHRPSAVYTKQNGLWIARRAKSASSGVMVGRRIAIRHLGGMESASASRSTRLGLGTSTAPLEDASASGATGVKAS